MILNSTRQANHHHVRSAGSYRTRPAWPACRRRTVFSCRSTTALPAPAWRAGRGGRPAEWCRRDIAGAIRYLVAEGIRWRVMPCDFPPCQTVYGVLDSWEKSGATESMHAGLREQCRVAAGRRPGPARRRSSTPSR